MNGRLHGLRPFPLAALIAALAALLALPAAPSAAPRAPSASRAATLAATSPAAPSGASSNPAHAAPASPGAAMRITSPAFADGQSIPDRYTCDSEELSPALAFHDVPAGTRSLALIVDDPDAPMGAWDHWLLFNLPPDAAGIPELPLGAEASELGRTAKSGLNSWRETGWGGPCPPSGTHRYYFTLYALDIMLPLKEGASRADLARAMEHHVLATARLMGTYSRGR